jgi:hypothetical protein
MDFPKNPIPSFSDKNVMPLLSNAFAPPDHSALQCSVDVDSESTQSPDVVIMKLASNLTRKTELALLKLGEVGISYLTSTIADYYVHQVASGELPLPKALLPLDFEITDDHMFEEMEKTRLVSLLLVHFPVVVLTL